MAPFQVWATHRDAVQIGELGNRERLADPAADGDVRLNDVYRATLEETGKCRAGLEHFAARHGNLELIGKRLVPGIASLG